MDNDTDLEGHTAIDLYLAPLSFEFSVMDIVGYIYNVLRDISVSSTISDTNMQIFTRNIDVSKINSLLSMVNILESSALEEAIPYGDFRSVADIEVGEEIGGDAEVIEPLSLKGVLTDIVSALKLCYVGLYVNGKVNLVDFYDNLQSIIFTENLGVKIEQLSSLVNNLNTQFSDRDPILFTLNTYNFLVAHEGFSDAIDLNGLVLDILENHSILSLG